MPPYPPVWCLLLILGYNGRIFVTTQSDPCIAANVMPDLDKRSTKYTANPGTGEHPLCDKDNIPSNGQWYTSEGQEMPTTPPPLQSCGTGFPIWMRGHLPRQQDGIVDRGGCMKGPGGSCTFSFPIKVKACQGYHVYFLKPVLMCDAAYCFGSVDPPPKFQPSAVVVEANAVERNYDPARTEFLCRFEPSLTESLFYQVKWFVDGTLNYTSPAVNESIIENTKLSEDYIKGLGVEIQCVVQAKLSQNGMPGPQTHSVPLFAGIIVPKQEILLERNDGKATFTIRPTIPFGCSINRHCNLFLDMMFHGIDHTSCKGQILGQSSCHIEIEKYNWNQTKDIVVAWGDTGTYNLDPSLEFSVSLKTSMPLDHPFWNGYSPPAIKIRVMQHRVQKKGYHCSAQNDPHMTDFNQQYYDHMIPGTYVMYDHVNTQDKTMQVQIKLTPCNNNNNIYCTCGVAVRAGGDLYVIDFCDVHNPYFDYVRCGDGILDVAKYDSTAKRYNIQFPTGTEVDIYVTKTYSDNNGNLLNVFIYPSGDDYKSTQGLCANYTENGSELLKHADGTLDNDRQTFSKSWRVDPRSDLFEVRKHDSIVLDGWPKAVKFCNCSSYFEEHVHVNCSSSTIVKCSREKYFTTLQSQKCSSTHSHRKKSLQFPSHKPQRRRKYLKTAKVTLNAADAEAYCYDFMSSSHAFQTCATVPNVPSQHTIDICALDIQLTNTTDWSAQSLESLKGKCLGELRKNKTLWEEPDASGESVASVIEQVLCPGVPECSGHGACVNGSCACDTGRGSSDCSIDTTTPPDISGIRGEGLCDINELACDTIMLIGHEILDSRNLTCKLSQFDIALDGTTNFDMDTFTVPAKHETLLEVHCNLQHNTARLRKRKGYTNSFVRGHTVRVSYDSVHFGDEFKFYVYNEICQIFHKQGQNISFHLKSNYCFIQNTCVVHGMINPLDAQKRCDVGQSRMGWSKLKGNPAGDIFCKFDVNGWFDCEIRIIFHFEVITFLWGISNSFVRFCRCIVLKNLRQSR